MNSFYVTSKRGEHMAFTSDHKTLVGPCSSEIELAQSLKRLNINLSDYRYSSSKENSLYKIIWTKVLNRNRNL